MEKKRWSDNTKKRGMDQMQVSVPGAKERLVGFRVFIQCIEVLFLSDKSELDIKF